MQFILTDAALKRKIYVDRIKDFEDGVWEHLLKYYALNATEATHVKWAVTIARILTAISKKRMHSLKMSSNFIYTSLYKEPYEGTELKFVQNDIEFCSWIRFSFHYVGE
jgi:hypothetical protein